MAKRTLTVRKRQTLFDLCLQEYGGIGGLFALAEANGASITNGLSPGQVLAVPEVADVDVDRDILDLYGRKRHVPATGWIDTPGGIPGWEVGGGTVAGDGIGYWFVEDDFVIQ